MPISRSDALANAKKVMDTAQYKTLCQMIDEAIEQGTLVSLPITISLENVPRYLVERVIEEYRALDWTCEIIPDQREGDYLRLS